MMNKDNEKDTHHLSVDHLLEKYSDQTVLDENELKHIYNNIEQQTASQRSEFTQLKRPRPLKKSSTAPFVIIVLSVLIIAAGAILYLSDIAGADILERIFPAAGLQDTEAVANSSRALLRQLQLDSQIEALRLNLEINRIATQISAIPSEASVQQGGADSGLDESALEAERDQLQARLQQLENERTTLESEHSDILQQLEATREEAASVYAQAATATRQRIAVINQYTSQLDNIMRFININNLNGTENAIDIFDNFLDRPIFSADQLLVSLLQTGRATSTNLRLLLDRLVAYEQQVGFNTNAQLVAQTESELQDAKQENSRLNTEITSMNNQNNSLKSQIAALNRENEQLKVAAQENIANEPNAEETPDNNESGSSLRPQKIIDNERDLFIELVNVCDRAGNPTLSALAICNQLRSRLNN